MIPTHTFLLFPRRILSTQSLYKLKIFSLLIHYYNNVSQMCNLCSVFHSLNVRHSYLTSSSVCSYVCDCQFFNYGCPMYLVIQSFVPRLYLITLMYDLESVWFQRLMYFMYPMVYSGHVLYPKLAIVFVDLWNVK